MLSIRTLFQEELMLDLLGMANKYGFQLLETDISKRLNDSLSLKNVCDIYDMASIYGLDKLSHQCLLYMDRNAADIIRSDGFFNMTKVCTAVHSGSRTGGSLKWFSCIHWYIAIDRDESIISNTVWL